MKRRSRQQAFPIKQSRHLRHPDLHNGVIAEWLAQAAAKAAGHWQKALRRASRSAFLWQVDAVELLDREGSLLKLPSVGPHLDRQIQEWLRQPPATEPVPALRRNFLTIVQAKRVLQLHPGWSTQYKGDLQMHSLWSDGAGTILDMAKAASARGYEYIGMTDHSQGLKIAGGINESELSEQAKEIKAANQKLRSGPKPVRVLRSIEVNLSPDGTADMRPEALAALDLVVGSFHSALRKTEDQTERYLAALRNPNVQILGHPRGRIYNYRLGLSADWERVFEEAARLDKAVEVDAYPDRQDLDVELLILARDAGVRIAVDTDAHAPEQLKFVELGLAAALLAEIDPERIINFMPADDLLEWSGTHRERAKGPAAAKAGK